MAAVICVTFTFCVMNPVLASEIPILGSIFSKVADLYPFGKIPEENTVELALAEDFISTDGGITISVTEEYASNQACYIGMKVESEQAFPEMAATVDGGQQFIKARTVENYSFCPEERSNRRYIEGKFVDEHTFLGIIRIDYDEIRRYMEQSGTSKSDADILESFKVALRITEIASTLKDADLKWSVKEFTAYMGQDNAFPTLTKATTAPIDYMSENEEVATVDATTGAITLVAPGETKIIAGCDAADGFDWAEASYILTVKRQGEISAVYNFQDFTIDSDTKLGYMTDYPDIPYDGNKSFWWTTNPNEEGTYAAGSQFKPLTITNEGTQLTFQWGGISGHGNLRATTTSKVNNLQLGGGTAIAIKPTVADATLYDVVVYINNGNSKFDQTVDGLETNDEGTISSDTEANTITWTPKTDNSECYLDFEGGAYITKISVNYKKAASSGITAPAISEDTEVPAEYFNLQGIRVANPANGLFIKRQGKTATKVFIK